MHWNHETDPDGCSCRPTRRERAPSRNAAGGSTVDGDPNRADTSGRSGGTARVPWPPVRRSTDPSLDPLREQILEAIRARPGIRLTELVALLQRRDPTPGAPSRREVAYHVERLHWQDQLLRGRFAWDPVRWLFSAGDAWLWENEDARWLFRHREALRLVLDVAAHEGAYPLDRAVRTLGRNPLRVRIVVWRLDRRGFIEDAPLVDGELLPTRLLERVASTLSWRRSQTVTSVRSSRGDAVGPSDAHGSRDAPEPA